MSAYPIVLCLQDTTELDFNGPEAETRQSNGRELCRFSGFADPVFRPTAGTSTWYSRRGAGFKSVMERFVVVRGNLIRTTNARLPRSGSGWAIRRGRAWEGQPFESHTQGAQVPCSLPPSNKKAPFGAVLLLGGSGEIRTHERLTPSPVFKTGAFNRSATLPADTHYT